MSEEQGVLRAILVPALGAMALVGAIMLFVTSQREADVPDAGTLQPPPPQPAALPPEPSPEAPAEPEPDASVTAPTTLPAAAPAAPAEAARDAAVLKPEAQEHARKILLPSVMRAVEKGDLEYLRRLRTVFDQPRLKGTFGPNEIEALNLIIECVDHGPEARDEARDFLQFGGPSLLTDALKRACE